MSIATPFVVLFGALFVGSSGCAKSPVLHAETAQSVEKRQACSGRNRVCDAAAHCFLIDGTESNLGGGKSESCRAGSSQCSTLAVSYLVGKGHPSDPAKGVELARQGCKARDPLSCYNAARAQYLGVGLPASGVTEIVSLFQSACSAGIAEACTAVGELYKFSRDLGHDMRKATQAFDEGCHLGDAYGCARLAFQFSAGLGVEKNDDQRAYELYDRACSCSGGEGCAGKGQMLAKGLGVSKDIPAATKLLSETCEHGSMAGCVALGSLLEESELPKDRARARHLFEVSCDTIRKDGEGSHGCNQLGEMYAAGRGVPKDMHKAVKFFDDACIYRHSEACNSLGWSFWKGLGIEQNDKHAVELFEIACTFGSQRGCVNLGARYARGQVVGKDLAKASELFVAACASGFAQGCSAKGHLHEEAGERDDATTWYRKACERNRRHACKDLERLRGR